MATSIQRQRQPITADRVAYPTDRLVAPIDQVPQAQLAGPGAASVLAGSPIAGAIGSFCGAFMTHVYMFVGMPVFALDYSILPIAAAVVGGPGTLAGATFGAFILVPMSEALRGFGGLRIVFYGVFLVIFIVALPEGIFHYIQRKYHQIERWVGVEK